MRPEIKDFGVSKRKGLYVWFTVKNKHIAAKTATDPDEHIVMIRGGDTMDDLRRKLFRKEQDPAMESVMESVLRIVMGVYGAGGSLLPVQRNQSETVFMSRMAELALRMCLGEIKVETRMSYEQALSVIGEVYAVGPVMDT